MENYLEVMAQITVYYSKQSSITEFTVLTGIKFKSSCIPNRNDFLSLNEFSSQQAFFDIFPLIRWIPRNNSIIWLHNSIQKQVLVSRSRVTRVGLSKGLFWFFKIKIISCIIASRKHIRDFIKDIFGFSRVILGNN